MFTLYSNTLMLDARIWPGFEVQLALYNSGPANIACLNEIFVHWPSPTYGSQKQTCLVLYSSVSRASDQNTYLVLSSMRAVFHPGASVRTDLSLLYLKPTARPSFVIPEVLILRHI